jgi:outer membrane immunogenic protein
LALWPIGAAAAPPPAPIWSGIYVGINGGYGSGDVDYVFDSFDFLGQEKISHNPSNWLVGGHGGIMRQFGSVVAGFEAAYYGLRLTDTVESQALANRFREIDIHDLVTLTARLGYARDQWMAYVKGGYAMASVDTRIFVGGVPGGTTTSGREDGFTVGAGLELLCGHGFIVGIEYDYTKLDISDRNGIFAPNDPKPFTYRNFDDDIHMVTLRLSYLFGERTRVQPLK